MAAAYDQSRRGFTARAHKEQIRLAMTFRQFTNAELAMRAKVSPGTVGNILGKRETCNPETAAKIAKALGCKTEQLFTLEEIRYVA
ncbi:DNA-binding XRE family transcriptional regulator [Brevibacterium sanguinis]|uniref:DNA-binding XRE family transcriptional regulator n=2 Tax=Brevibacterium TaxID=1696 RepID=A0A366IKQ8_9MICO|nr:MULTISPECIES: helix-turn-helix transcriptional regulator [Brevibacterium]RBP66366.1 DNA-binding XRE family transcriptional regulator [Brevibacterium sanguinis]RBP73017.1 DNA-binding XRE family transcriptional regulator [Brevibacterium celere]